MTYREKPKLISCSERVPAPAAIVIII